MKNLSLTEDSFIIVKIDDEVYNSSDSGTVQLLKEKYSEFFNDKQVLIVPEKLCKDIIVFDEYEEDDEEDGFYPISY